VAAFQVERLAAEGRWGGSGSLQIKDRQKDHLLANLRAQGLSESELEEVEKADRPWVLTDYMIAILSPLNTDASVYNLFLVCVKPQGPEAYRAPCSDHAIAATLPSAA